MVEIQSVTFEHHREALGIGESKPRISWRFAETAKDWIQSSYELEILRSTDPKPQTCRVESSDSVLVPWPSTELKTRETASVRVRVTGAPGSEPAEWSKPVNVEASLLNREDWTAQLIAAERTLSTGDSLRPALFRKSFQLSKTVRSARLYITSYGVYEAHINGSRVGDHVLAPGWTSYKHRLEYHTFDVTRLLSKGGNAIGAEVGEGWYCGRLGWHGGKRNLYGDKLALLAQLEIEFEDGQKLNVDSNNTWKTSVGPIVSSELYDGEIYDASLELPEWSSSSFHDENWSCPEQIAFPTAQLIAPEGPPVRKTETLKPHTIFKSPSGKVVVDFGQNLVGWVRVRVSGPKGTKIVFTHTEVMEHGEVATRPLRDCKAVDTLTLSGKDIEWEPKFTFHGFRYAQVEGWPSESGEPGLGDIEAVVIHTDMERTGWFECSDTWVNKLHANIRWGMRGNFVSIPTDCPQRDERLGWTGDIQVFAPTANFLYDTAGTLKRWLKDVAVEQIQDYNGVTPLVVPNIFQFIETGMDIAQAVWGDAAVITPWDMYKSFGDPQILLDQYKSMKAWLENGIPRQENGLWILDTIQLGDWLDPAAPPSDPGNGKTDPHLIANAYLVHITELLAQVSQVLGLKDDLKHYTTGATKLKRLFQDEYITPNGRLAPDTMTSLTVALQFNLFATPSHISLAAQRLARIVQFSKFKIATGFVGTPLICPVLTSTGQTPLAYRMLLQRSCPSWLYPITMGATTMWERWDSMLPDGSINPGEMTSFNHYALGSVGAWLHATVGGIAAAEPGWRVVRFEPVPGGTITSAKVRHLSPYGMVGCEWKIEGKRLVMKATVPPNTTAKVKLPGQEVVSVGSGVHDFSVPYVAPE
jgi:alpha-L-rhamnosidase